MVDINLVLSKTQLEDAITILDMLCLSNLMDDHKKETRAILLAVFRDQYKRCIGEIGVNCPTCHKKLDTEVIG